MARGGTSTGCWVFYKGRKKKMEKNPYETKTVWFKVMYAGGPYRSFSCEIPDEWDEREFAEAAISIIEKISPSTEVRLER